ncbi:TetR/AcrR family transcriptional regulator [Methylobacterium sp. C25]|uniref:TetR/AcrR family transcriptional regulator n=1 Tax=Methylobacterium sp. C25 TaxID=2721622 RepID=UPI001F212199|nr:TetR family transcriptional regulator [Methylobacterium sp. C25]MCE4225716.1 TetR/AcrR family transcriptional regulator [Methylobacterium sp. C25]
MNTRPTGARERLLASAKTLFAEQGYERTTVRAVAQAAAADPALVIRYFGSKDGLFARAVEVDLRFPDLATLPREERGSRLARHVIALWDGPDGATLLPMLRACATHETAAETARGIFAGQVLAMVKGLGLSDPERRAALVASQVLGLVFCRYILGLPPVVAMDADAVAAGLGPTLQRYLHGAIT